MTTLIPKFEQVGSTTINRAINLKLQKTVSVKDFGAKGDGTTDDTTAIQAAITQVVTTGGAVYFPAGTYNVSSTLTVGSKVTLYGDGPQGSFIQVTSASINILNITGNYVSVNNLGFKTTQTAQTAGAYIVAAGIYCYINNFYMSKPYIGIKVTGTFTYIQEGVIEDTTSRNTAANSAYIWVNVAGEADCNINDIIMRIGSNTTSTWPAFGILWSNGVVIHASNCEVLQADIGLCVNPGTGATCLAGRFSNLYFDTILSHCAILTPSGTGTVQDINFNSVSFGANGGNGLSMVQTGTSNLAQIIVNACLFRQYITNNGTGIYINTYYTGPFFIIVSNCLIGDQQSGQFINGISTAGCSNFTLNGNDISYESGTGIITAGASDYYIITNNRAFGNGAANINDGATGTHKVVANNLS
jgi:hypothetical protein